MAAERNARGGVVDEVRSARRLNTTWNERKIRIGGKFIETTVVEEEGLTASCLAQHETRTSGRLETSPTRRGLRARCSSPYEGFVPR